MLLSRSGTVTVALPIARVPLAVTKLTVCCGPGTSGIVNVTVSASEPDALQLTDTFPTVALPPLPRLPPKRVTCGQKCDSVCNH